jgi:hypothetical protein
MAAIQNDDIDWSDDDAVHGFFDDTDSEGEFDGFDNEEGAFLRRNIVGNVLMTEFVPGTDRDFPADLETGWIREDADVLNAPFTGEAKLNVQMEAENPIDFFKLFITDDVINGIVVQTNIFAQTKKNADNLKTHSRIKKWLPVTLDEMKVFFALLMAMGLVEKSDVQHYWMTDACQETPFFKKYMSRDRFLAILSNFHLTNNADQVPRGQDGFDPLFKVRPFVTHVLNRSIDVYSPEQDLSFDEATCPWKGHLRFRVYNPAKPTKFGIKLYQVCEATSGYTIGFDIYTGSAPCVEYADALDIDPDCTKTTKVVLGLLGRCGLLDNGHHVYLDNYYTSPELFSELYLLNTYACGTLRKNRIGTPEALKRPTLKLKPSECIFRRKDNLLAVKFHDKRDVHALTTIHQATVSVLNKIDHNTHAPVTKPTCIVDYIASMGGVDVADQMNQNYSCLRKTTKWYKKLFFHLFTVCTVNAYLLYRKYAPEAGKNGHHAFRMYVCEALLREAEGAPRPATEKGRKHKGDKPTRLTDRHFPDNIPAKPGAKRMRPCRDCVGCNPTLKDRVTFKRKQTAFWCPECDVALCVPRCFQVYHTVKHYRRVLLPGANESSSESSNESSSADSD